MGLVIAVAIIILMLWIAKTWLPQPWQTPIMVILVLVALAFLITTLFPGAASVRVR